MNITAILMFTFSIFFSRDCQQKRLDMQISKTKVQVEPSQKIFNNLDKILSPFEDMTEYALDNNEKGILKSLRKIETAINNLTFSKNLLSQSVKIFNLKIKYLKKIIKQKDNKQIALVSTEIFKYNIINFAYAKKIKNQISIEYLDYMGFKILALLNDKEIDWKNSEQTVSDVQKEWLILSSKVSNENLKNSFNYLFKGIHLSIKNRDKKMSEILAFLDLNLVDVLENNI